MNFADPDLWLALITLTALEIVLGIDNIIFLSIMAAKLPPHQQSRARTIGLAGPMGFSVAVELLNLRMRRAMARKAAAGERSPG